MLDKLFTALIMFLLGGIAGYNAYQIYLNKDARHHAGECFAYKGEPLVVRIDDVYDGKYFYTASIMGLVTMKDSEIIKRFDEEVEKGFSPYKCSEAGL